jgi:hypothetical protein
VNRIVQTPFSVNCEEVTLANFARKVTNEKVIYQGFTVPVGLKQNMSQKFCFSRKKDGSILSQATSVVMLPALIPTTRHLSRSQIRVIRLEDWYVLLTVFSYRCLLDVSWIRALPEWRARLFRRCSEWRGSGSACIG